MKNFKDFFSYFTIFSNNYCPLLIPTNNFFNKFSVKSILEKAEGISKKKTKNKNQKNSEKLFFFKNYFIVNFAFLLTAAYVLSPANLATKLYVPFLFKLTFTVATPLELVLAE